MPRTSDKREQIYQFLRDFTRANGYAPSVREICAAVGLKSTASVHYHMKALAEEGRIDMDASKKRAVSLPGGRLGEIPIVGVVTAGVPILAVEQIEGYLPWDEDGECFALRVRGDSMIGAGILEGDLVIVRPQPTADNGQIVVALLGDEATVKRLQRRDGHVWLMPENPAYSPIPGDEAQLVGRVKAVVRKY